MIIGVARKRFWFAAILGLSILFYTIQQADLKRLGQNLQDIDPFWAVAVLAASAVSYIFIAAVLFRLLKNIGHAIPFSSAFQISLLSCTLNYLMAIGGLSGVAAKVYLLSRERIPPSKTLSVSMVHGFLTNTVAVVFIYLGFFFLYSEYKMSTREMEVGVFILLVAFGLTWVTVQILIHEGFRKRLWHLLLRLGMAICSTLHHPRWLHQERAEVFFENFNESMNLIVKNARALIVPATYALLDWLFMFLCLKFSFQAAHYPVSNSTILVGFSIGIFATLFSFTPASIGVMEGSMAGSFYLMGLDYERALTVTLVYRFAYFVLPIFVSLFFYRHFFRPATDDSDPDETDR